MKNISLFCLTLNPNHEQIIKKLSLIPVGLGDKQFSSSFFSDKKGFSIADKNPFYGEYTFHYWLWKNHLHKIQTPWIGFCQYRKFFIKENISYQDINFETLKDLLILKIEKKNEDFDCILGSKFSVENYKFSKIFKNYLSEFVLNPSLFYNKKKRNLKLHFDLYHGKGNLDKAISLLDEHNKNDFKNYMNNENSFHPHNMFICKTELIKNYYEEIFKWLEKCENEFGFKNLEGYGLQRIYGFLAERFLSYWFSKKFKVKEYPIIVKDLSDYQK